MTIDRGRPLPRGMPGSQTETSGLVLRLIPEETSNINQFPDFCRGSRQYEGLPVVFHLEPAVLVGPYAGLDLPPDGTFVQ